MGGVHFFHCQKIIQVKKGESRGGRRQGSSGAAQTNLGGGKEAGFAEMNFCGELLCTLEAERERLEWSTELRSLGGGKGAGKQKHARSCNRIHGCKGRF